jgi:hypothetical protein
MVLVAGLALLASCVDRTIATDGGEEEPGAGSTGDGGDDPDSDGPDGGSPDGGGPDDGGNTGADDGWTTDDGDDTGDDGCAFYGGCPGDVGNDYECDVWLQDCPEGEKCMPWANDGGSAWNALKCSYLDPDPKQPGEECTVEGSGVSGVDDCDISSMCWDVDPETNMGYCLSFCEGTPDAPTCSAPGTLCTIWNDGVLILCLVPCDPLLQDCAGDDLCVPTFEGDAFVCVLDASHDEGQYGDPCEFVNNCDPGLACINADFVPDCLSSIGCCTEYCDLTAVDPMAACSATPDQGVECVPWFEEGQAPPGYEHVGACLIPP